MRTGTAYGVLLLVASAAAVATVAWPAARFAAGTREPAATPAPPTLAPPVSAAPIRHSAAVDAAAKRESLAPSHYAPAFGLDGAGGLVVDVQPGSGVATVFEVDLRVGSLALRRARTAGDVEPGLFGRGWRTELDTRVTPTAGGIAVRRLEGLSFFAPLVENVYVSLWGEVELLRRTSAGYELAGSRGDVLRFDGKGALVASEPGFTVTRAPGGLRLDSAEGTLTLDLDSSGRVTRAVAGAQTLSYSYDASGELATVEGSRARRYAVEHGRIARIDGDEDLALAMRYDSRGRVASLETGAWRQTYAFDLDRDEPQASVETPRGRWTYWLSANRWRVETPLGRERVFFDARGRVLGKQGPGGARQTSGRRLTDPWPSSLPGGDIERATDSAGRLTSVSGPGVRELFQWGESGELVGRTSVDGRTSRYLYDDVGRLVSDTGPEGATAYGYDGAGRLEAVTTPAGVEWTSRWNGAQLAAQDGPHGAVSFQRRAGRLAGRKDASGRSFSYRYDSFGRPVEVASADGQVEEFAYDGAGRLVAFSGSEGGTTLERDTHGQVSAVTGGGFTLRYTHEASSDSVATPWGTFSRAYDAEGRERGLKSPAGTFRFDYDPAGQRVATHFPNGVTLKAKRDDLGRATAFSAERPGGGAPLLEASTEWNTRHEVVQQRLNGRLRAYAYDAAGRLARVSGSAGARGYAYDGDGNRLRETRGARSRACRYDPRGRLISRGGERFSYDGAGRLIERRAASGSDRFGYDGLGRLAWAQRANRPRVSYGYDALGRVVSRAVSAEARQDTTYYVYEGSRLLAELGPGKRKRVYVYGPTLDEPLAYSEGDRWTYLLTNDQHTLLGYVGDAGEHLASVELGAFGEVRSADLRRPVFYGGRLYDPIARLYPMRARFYDPALGRFLTPDPSGLRGGVNAYAYARNRPLDRIDPLGLWDWVPTWAERKPGDVDRPEPGVVASTRTFLTHAGGFAEHLWEDAKAGRARDRIYGHVDAYSSFMSLGLLGTNLSALAEDPAEAARGTAYGEGSGWAFAGISGAPLAWAGAKALGRGVVLAPQAPAALLNGARQLKSSAPTWVPRARAGLAASPTVIADASSAAWANRAAIATATAAFLKGQAGAVWDVTGRPLVTVGQSWVDGLAGLALRSKDLVTPGVTGLTKAGGGSEAVSTVLASPDVARVATVARSSQSEGTAVGLSGKLEGRSGGGAAGWDTPRHAHKPPKAPSGYQSVHAPPPAWLSDRMAKTVDAVRAGKAGPDASADDVAHFLSETYEHINEVNALTKALGGAPRVIPRSASGSEPLRGIHDFGERASLRRVKAFLEGVKREPLKTYQGEVVPVPKWLERLVADAERTGATTLDVGKLAPDVAAGLARPGGADAYAIKLHNLAPHHTQTWRSANSANGKAVIEAIADKVVAMRQPRIYRQKAIPFEEIRTFLLRDIENGVLPAGARPLIERAIATQAKLERIPGSGVNPYHLFDETLAAEAGAVAKVAPLRFGADDLVYGPSARGKLRELQERAGGRLLTDLEKPTELTFIEFSERTLSSQLGSGGAGALRPHAHGRRRRRSGRDGPSRRSRNVGRVALDS